MSRPRKQKHDRRSWLAGRESGLREAAKARAEEEARERQSAAHAKRTQATRRAYEAERLRRHVAEPFSAERAALLKGGC